MVFRNYPVKTPVDKSMYILSLHAKGKTDHQKELVRAAIKEVKQYHQTKGQERSLSMKGILKKLSDKLRESEYALYIHKNKVPKR